MGIIRTQTELFRRSSTILYVYISRNDKKVGICLHFKTIQTPSRLNVSTDTSLFAVFRANLLHENEILAIIDVKFVENHTIFDQKRSFLHYFQVV